MGGDTKPRGKLPNVDDGTPKDRYTSAMGWWAAFGAITLLAFGTRFYKVEEPAHVCWDETHFGKMGGWYINRTYFFDVHPPLGKMLIGYSGYLTGYDAKFPFEKPGEKFDGANYVGMRMFCTLLGTMVVPFSFIIVWEMTRSLVAASLSSTLILLDVGILTLSRYILLDPIMFFFMMAAIMGLTKFNSAKHVAFSVRWWSWLVFTGSMLACSMGVKFVGLFVVLFVGLATIADLWQMYGDLSKPVSETVKHFVARVFGLIVVPTIVYLVIFAVHLSVLNRSGPGDMLLSSEFQSQLIGNKNFNHTMARDVAYGAVVTIKNHRPAGAFLHSHKDVYPEGVGAPQQQVTSYGHQDQHNDFLVKRKDDTVVEGPEGEDGVQLVRHNDLIRLEHVATRRNLHSHREPAPISKKHFQVTAYGLNGTGDVQDVWRVQLVDGREGEVLSVITRKFRLIHESLGCALCATKNAKLPEWGFSQDEVSCNPNIRDPDAIWNVEGNVNSKLENVSMSDFAPGFIGKFIEQHLLMVRSNAGLKPKAGDVLSRPWQWPFNHKGLYFSGDDFRVYLLGNPLVWWGNIVLLVVFLAAYTANGVREQRGYPDEPHVKARKDRMSNACGWLFVGWLLHYAPFWTMGRILYYHHYFPALLFSSMLTGVMLDYLLESLPQVFSGKTAKNVYHWGLGGILSATVYSFYLFSPLTYGMTGPMADLQNSTYHSIKWMQTWEF